MLRVRIFLLALFTLVAASLSPAAAVTNGPVSTTLSSTNYSVYYTTSMQAYDIFTITGTPNASASYPIGGSIDGLGTNPFFKLPWWNPTNSSTALQAAYQWYNASGWPINDGVRFPNGTNNVTPFFAFGSQNAGFLTDYIALQYDPAAPNTPTIINGSVSSFDSYSFALAGVSN